MVDADGVLEDLTQAMVVYINEKYGTTTKFEDIRDWDLGKAFPTLTREQVYGAEWEEALYSRLRPIDGAPKYLKKLIDDGHEVYVVTNTPYQAIAFKIDAVMKKYYPFLSWKNFILTSNKQMIAGDILIDDGVHNLMNGRYRKLLFSAPYNEAFDAEGSGMIRVRSWEEIYQTISAMNQ